MGLSAGVNLEFLTPCNAREFHMADVVFYPITSLMYAALAGWLIINPGMGPIGAAIGAHLVATGVFGFSLVTWSKGRAIWAWALVGWTIALLGFPLMGMLATAVAFILTRVVFRRSLYNVEGIADATAMDDRPTNAVEAAHELEIALLDELEIEPIVERQEKMLVFTQFQSLTEPLADYLATIFGSAGLVLHGGTAVRKRGGLVDTFQSPDGPPFFVISLKAGGSGLNLTAASHVVHFDRWWNPAVENQATDRAFRIGQTHNVLVHKFVCRGTVEERIDAMIRDKQAVADGLLNQGGETLLTELSNDELLQFVAVDLGRATADE